MAEALADKGCHPLSKQTDLARNSKRINRKTCVRIRPSQVDLVEKVFWAVPLAEWETLLASPGKFVLNVAEVLPQKED